MGSMAVNANFWTSLHEVIISGDFQDKVVIAQELKLWSGLELDEAAAWASRNGWSCILEACCPGPQGAICWRGHLRQAGRGAALC